MPPAEPPPPSPGPSSPPGLRDDYETSPLPLAKLAARYGLSAYDITRFRLAEGWTARSNTIGAIKTFRIAGALDRLTSAIGASSNSIPSASSPDGTPEDPPVIGGSIRAPSTSPPGPGSRAQPWSGEREAAERPSQVARRATPLRSRRKSSGTPAHRQNLIARLHDLVDQKIAEIEKRLASDKTVSPADSERESKAIGFFIKQLEHLKDVADAEVRTQRSADSPVADPTARLEAERLRADLVERIDRLRRSRTDATSAG